MKEKFLSGRFLFTIVAAFVFGWISITGVLSSDDIKEIIMVVLVFYFTRNDRKGEA